MLISKFGQSAIDSNYVYLKIPEAAEYDYEVNENNGIVELAWTPNAGFRNVYISFVAGYSTAPDSLQQAVKITVKDWYSKYSSSLYGISKYSIGDLSYSFSDVSTLLKSNTNVSFPPEAVSLLSKYRKTLV